MRSVLILSMFSASLAFADWDDFEETRELSLDAASLASLTVNAGAGSLVIEGDRGADAVDTGRLPSPCDGPDRKHVPNGEGEADAHAPGPGR